jgi:hypothetical protein
MWRDGCSFSHQGLPIEVGKGRCCTSGLAPQRLRVPPTEINRYQYKVIAQVVILLA